MDMSPKPRKVKEGDPGTVKTTLVLPEDLWRRAKVRALDEHCDLRDLLIEGLELALRRPKGSR